MSYKSDLIKEAELGDAEAQFNLATAYYVAIIPNKKKAFYWYECAAKQGHPEAQRFLGMCYLCGEGVKADEQMAYEWYILSARNGDVEAQKFLKTRGISY